MLANIEGVKELPTECGKSTCRTKRGTVCVCWCCPLGDCYDDLAKCNINCHPSNYPTKIIISP